jgi:hypothetical protein
MLKLSTRFTIALLCFSLGILATGLANSSRSSRVEQVVVHHQSESVRDETHVIRAGDDNSRRASIADTVESLRRIKTDQFDTNIPPAAKPLLTLLKSQLSEVIGDTLNSENLLRDTPQHVQTAILSRLKDAGVTVRKWEDVAYSENYFQEPYVYGDIYGITVEQPAGHPELRVATTTLGISCGEDTSLYVFKYDGSRWQFVLAQESNDYDKVSGAQGLFQYAVSPKKTKGDDFFVVTANVNPWCSSNWQSLRYKVLRPDIEAYQPRTILSAEDTIYLGGGDPPYKLNVKDDGFKLEFPGEGNPDEVTRGRVLGYTVKGNQVVRATR